MPRHSITRRDLIKAAIAAGAGASLAPSLLARPFLNSQPEDRPSHIPSKAPPARADACIFIYLPGGIAAADTWDPKAHTPFRAGMKGSQLLGTCPSIPTAADGIRLGAGFDQLATVMDRATILRSLSSDVLFGAVHLRAQHTLMTGYIHPAGFRAPSIGAIVGRTLGRRHPQVPEYIYIGRDIDTSDTEKQFIAEYLGPGFLGTAAAPFMIPDPSAGLATLDPVQGMDRQRLDKRQALLKRLTDLQDQGLLDSPTAAAHRKMLADARAMMDSPVKKAFDFTEEQPATLNAYSPRINHDQLLDKTYDYGHRFGRGLLLARLLVEQDARFVQVEYQYGPFKGFDMHESGGQRMAEMKKQIDGPIAQLIRDLDQRGLLKRTLVVIATEFGRTIASAPSAGQEPEGSAETHNGEKLVIENEKMYGFHGHFSSCSSMLFFGGGFKAGYAHGKTADHHPMLAVENPVKLIDAHATLYTALGIAPDHSYINESRPVYITKDGKGKAATALLA